VVGSFIYLSEEIAAIFESIITNLDLNMNQGQRETFATLNDLINLIDIFGLDTRGIKPLTSSLISSE
jgi:hypothetical protein